MSFVRPATLPSRRTPFRRVSSWFSILIAFGLCQFAESAFALVDLPPKMHAAAQHLVATQKPSGFLVYGFNFLSDKESEPEHMSGPNLTRQAFASAVLADYAMLTHDAPVSRALAEMITAMSGRSLPFGKPGLGRVVESTRLLSAPVGRWKITKSLESLGLLYTPHGSGGVLSPDAKYDNAHTGATALALLAELRYSRGGDARFAAQRARWLEALIDLKMPGSGFRMMATSIDHHPYYDGEAWLALAIYNRMLPSDARVHDFLSEVDDDLLRLHARDSNKQNFHWLAMAAAHRFADTRDARFADFARSYLQWIVKRAKREPSDGNDCAVLEGVADSLAALNSAGEANSELAKNARTWIEHELVKMDGMQIAPDQQELAFTNARILAPRMREFAGAYRAGVYSASTQVDITAHCLSGMIKIVRNNLLAGSTTRP